MNKQTDDFALDIEFGKWLGQIRTAAHLTVRDAAKQTGITEERLMSLELGYAERGIRRNEATSLSKIYNVKLEELLQRALAAE